MFMVCMLNVSPFLCQYGSHLRGRYVRYRMHYYAVCYAVHACMRHYDIGAEGYYVRLLAMLCVLHVCMTL